MTSDASTEQSKPSSKPTVTILVGMVGSGKTSQARTLCDIYANTIRISNDDIVAMLEPHYACYNPDHRHLYKLIEMNTFMSALAMGFNVVVDRTSLKKSERFRFIHAAQLMGAGHIIARCLPVHAYERLLDRRMNEPRGYSREHWRSVMEKHWAERELVTYDEGFDQIADESSGALVKR